MASHAAYWNPLELACTNIVEILEKDSVSSVKLVGEAGIGKTWMAHEICKRATSKDGSFYIALWLNLNKEIDEMSLYRDIASQLSLFIDKEESEEDDSDEEESIQDAKERNDLDLMKLKDQIKKKLDRKKFNREGKRHLLLVLDDEGRVTTEEKVVEGFYLGDFLKPLKILRTIRKGDEDAKNSDWKIDSPAPYEDFPSDSTDELHVSPASDEAHAHIDQEIRSEEEIHSDPMNKVTPLPEPHTIDISQFLRDTFTDDYLVILLELVIKDGLLESLETAWGKDNGFLKLRIVEMSLGLPAAVVVLAKSLNCIAQKLPFRLSQKQDEVFKIAVLSSLPSVSDHSYEVMPRRNPILHLAYELLKADDTTKTSIVDCFWHCLSFFDHCGCVNYQELIAHWILEGYFDPVISVTKAYKAGYAILMELMNRGFLKIQEDNVVMPEVAMKNVTDLRSRGLSGTSRLGLAKVFGCEVSKGLGKTNQVDDIIEAVRATRKGEKITTVLVSGNRLLHTTPEKFFENLKDVEILGLLQPAMAPFVSYLVKLVKLRVLVIRDCLQLNDIEELKALEGLHVLEVSGASSVKRISEDFFKAMPDLQSLHLSGLQITYSPSSISELKKLRCLIIRDCPLLEDLPEIQELVNLEVVDVSGARGLQSCFEITKGESKHPFKNKNLYHLRNLQHLDFSESQIERLPMFEDSAIGDKINSLTRLLLRDCIKLRRLTTLKPLSGLQILDLSGTRSLVMILEVCFEEKKQLRILNLSGSNLPQLPSTFEDLSNLNELLLKDCTNLELLPNIQKLTSLEVIDVSGCTKLHTIEGSFEYMYYLREVNLSGTRLKTPKFPKESYLFCPKRIILADKRLFEGEDWNQIKKDIIIRESSEKASSSDISEKESSEIQSSKPLCSGIPRKRERFHQISIYQKSLPFVYSESHPEVLEICGSNDLLDLDNKALAGAEYVSFVDISSTRIKTIFDKIRSVKSCWVRMCKDIEHLFFDVDEDSLGSLETLSITNLRLLETISSNDSFKTGLRSLVVKEPQLRHPPPSFEPRPLRKFNMRGAASRTAFGWIVGRPISEPETWVIKKKNDSFKNLKKLSIDCCPNIRTIFHVADQVPSSLQVLHIKCCEKLETVFEEGQVSTLTTLRLHDLPVLSALGVKLPNLEIFKKSNCPNLMEDLRTTSAV